MHVNAGATAVHERADLACICAVATYDVTAEPPSDAGAPHDTTTDPSPAVAFNAVGAPGATEHVSEALVNWRSRYGYPVFAPAQIPHVLVASVAQPCTIGQPAAENIANDFISVVDLPVPTKLAAWPDVAASQNESVTVGSAASPMPPTRPPTSVMPVTRPAAYERVTGDPPHPPTRPPT